MLVMNSRKNCNAAATDTVSTTVVAANTAAAVTGADLAAIAKCGHVTTSEADSL